MNIKKFTIYGSVLSAVFAVGAISASAQDVCGEANQADREELTGIMSKSYNSRDIPERKKAVEAAKKFLEKYGSCPNEKEVVDYYKKYVPASEEWIKKQELAAKESEIVNRFNDGLKNKNWDAVYKSGQELMDFDYKKYSPALFVLASIGFDETRKSPPVTTWNDRTVKYAKQAIAEIKAGKTFPSYGLDPFKYNDANDALGWMNYTIALISQFDKKDKKTGAQYYYEATKIPGTFQQNPDAYLGIGSYYLDLMNAAIPELKAKADAHEALLSRKDPAPTEEELKASLDGVNAKRAELNGIFERVLDAYSRAYATVKNSTDAAKKAQAKDILDNKLKVVYDNRFADKKGAGLDMWITQAVARPMPDPLTPIQPVSETAPATKSAAAAPAATAPVKPATPAVTAKPATPATPKPTTAKPATAITPKPATKNGKINN